MTSIPKRYAATSLGFRWENRDGNLETILATVPLNHILTFIITASPSGFLFRVTEFMHNADRTVTTVKTIATVFEVLVHILGTK